MNIDTDESTSLDPRLRDFKSADEWSAASTRLNYIERYNTKPTDCGSYWGHEGRKVSVSLRLFVRIFAFPGLSLAIAPGVISIIAITCTGSPLNDNNFYLVGVSIGILLPLFYSTITVLVSLLAALADWKLSWISAR